MNAVQETPPQEAAPVEPAPPAQVQVPVRPELKTRLTEGQANTIYRQAYHLSQRGQFDQASALFGMLHLYFPQEPKYTHAVAVCYRKLERYEDALLMFAKTLELAPTEYGPAFQLAECLMHLDQHGQALELLETIAKAAQWHGDAATLERAAALSSFIERQKA